MARYEVTGPDGAKYEINAPDGMSEQEVLARFQSEMAKQPEPKKPSKGLGAVRAGLQGMTFGFSDELGAGAAAIPAAISDAVAGRGFNPVKAYRDMHQSLQDERKAYKEAHPGTALAAEMGGALTTGGLAATKLLALPALRNMSTVGKIATTGGIEGGVYGFGSADRGERLSGTAMGSAAGATLGPVAHGAGAVVRPLVRPLASRAKHSILGTPGGDARKHLAATLAREGIDSVDALGNSVAGKDKALATIADVSQGGRGLLEGLVSDADSNATRALAKQTLEGRNKALNQRVFQSLDEGLNNPNITIKQAQAAIRESRGQQASQLYGLAKNKPIQQTDNLKKVFAVDEVDAAIRKASGRLKKERATGETITNLDVLDETKRILDDQIESAFRRGERNEGRRLLGVKRMLVKELDDQVPEYKAARDAYSHDSSLLDAGEHGKKILRSDVDYLDDLIEDMSESELQMFRLGAQKAIREKMMQGREGTNTVNRILSEINLDRMRRAFPSDEAFNTFRDNLKFEAELFDTSRVLHNSMTALRQSSQRSLDNGLVEAPQLGQDMPGMVAQGINKILNRGLSPDARDELGKILLTPLSELDPRTLEQVNREIMSLLPVGRRTMARQMLDSIGGAPLALGATAVPITQ